MSSSPVEERAALVALLRSLPPGTRWATATDRVLEVGSAREVWNEQCGDTLLPDPHDDRLLSEARTDLERWEAQGARFLPILDQAYPERLREVHQAPPFVFAAGELRESDPAIAVVGSRDASDRGLAIAKELATRLASMSVTVLSGLAAGIDAMAHRSALDVGGRTVAVIGTGLSKSYPASNKQLQAEIAQRGLLLSQFWPDSPPQRHNFLMRNAVMSGYGRATVVVEAGEKSGARAQARMAVEHGRPVILSDLVLARNEWAKRLLGRPGVHIVSTLDETMNQINQILAQESEVDSLLGDLLGSAL